MMTLSFKSIFIIIAVAISAVIFLYQHHASSFIELAPGFEDFNLVYLANDQIRG